MERSPRVLVVEDDRDIADVLRRSLDLDGYEVRLAGDGEAALSQAEVFEPDAVILDLGLPKLDGVAALRRMRDAGVRSRVLVLTTFADDAQVRDAVQAGAIGYLLKDISRADLLAATEESFEEVMRTNVQGPYFLTQAVARLLVQQQARDAGPMRAIVFVTSV